MTQPAARTRLYNYTEYATANPGAPYNAAQHDAEANADIATINQLCTNIGLIQRDDGQLKNQSVHQDAFSTAALALIASNFTPRGLWLTATAYAIGNLVQNGTSSYVCSTAHTSGTFNTDLAAGRWIILGATASSSASSISNTPAGNIAATDVQAAINELDAEKAALAGSSAQVFSVGSATSANHAPRASQVQNNSLFFAVAAGTADAMTATISTGAITALVDGFEVSIRAFGANTLTNPTLNLTLGSTATGALTIINGVTGGALVAGNISGAAHEMLLRYKAGVTSWCLMNPATVSSTNPLFMPLSASIAANALTATLASGAKLDFNDGTSVITSGALTVTASSGSTLGTVSAQASRIWVVAVKNGGTPELALRNNVNGTSVSWPALRSTISTTAEGGLGAADSTQVFYSTTARAAQPWCIVGYIDSTQTTAGTWAQALTLVQGFGPGIPLPGQIVAVTSASNSSRVAATNLIPADDTIPQISEGDSANIDCTLTPTSAANILIADSLCCIGTNGALAAISSMFRDGAANAIRAGATASNTSNTYAQVELHYEAVANTASSTTISIRFGTNSAANGDLNGGGSTRVFGGVNTSYNTLREMQV